MINKLFSILFFLSCLVNDYTPLLNIQHTSNFKTNIFINEINYSSDGDSTIINYIEIVNPTDNYYNFSNYELEIIRDDFQFSLKFDANQLILPFGYSLLKFSDDAILPLPDYIFESIEFVSKISVTFKSMTNAYEDDILILSKENEGFILDRLGTNISINRIWKEGQPYTSNDNSLVFEYAIVTTPTNSALGVAKYIMDEDIPGQAKQKFPIAKMMIMSLSSAQFSYFLNDNSEMLIKARQRYDAWAIAVGDYDPYNQGISSTDKSLPRILLIGILFIGFIIVCSFFLRKKTYYEK